MTTEPGCNLYFQMTNPKYLSWEFYEPYTTVEPAFGELGLLVYMRTYSRFIPYDWANKYYQSEDDYDNLLKMCPVQLQRREKWCETVLRAVEYSISLDKVTPLEELQKEAEELFDAIFNMRVFPAGRTLWIGGTKSAISTPSANFNCSFRTIDSISAIAEGFYLLLLGSGFGFSIEKQYIEHFPALISGKSIKSWFAKGDKLEHTEVWSGYDAFDCTNCHLEPDSYWNEGLKDLVVGGSLTIYVGDSKEGWCEALKIFLLALSIESIKQIDIDYGAIRPAGERLKTFGGRASGYKALEDLFKKIHAIVEENPVKGKYALSSVQILDIVNAMGEAVVVGGVRRTSEIALGDVDDVPFLNAKKDLWSSDELAYKRSTRVISNNSVVLREKPTREWFHEVMESVKTNGEPGFYSLENANKRLARLNGSLTNPPIPPEQARIGTNPCLSIDTWIHTENGAKQIKDLLGKQVGLYVDGHLFSTDSRGFYKTGNKELFRITTKEGYSIDATEDHPIMTVLYKTRKKEIADFVKVADLSVGQKIKLHNHRDITPWLGKGSQEEGYILGSLIGDGCLSLGAPEGKHQAHLRYWDKDAGSSTCADYAVSAVATISGARKPALYHHITNGYQQINSVFLYRLAGEYGITSTTNKQVTDKIEEGSYEFCVGFLAGIFDADGSVQGSQEKGVSIRLSQSNKQNLTRVQRMLARVGVISTIYDRHPHRLHYLPDGRGSNAIFECQATYELVISKTNLTTFFDIVPLKHEAKINRLSELLSNYKRGINRENFAATITSIESIGIHDVYDCTVPSVHRFDANGFVVHNCGEILLSNFGTCNLTEVNMMGCLDNEGYFDDDVFIRSVYLATRMGSRMTTVEMFHPDWDRTQKRDRLLGVSLTGVVELFQLKDYWDESFYEYLYLLARRTARHTADEYHRYLGIPRSLLTTCCKPSGTLSNLPGVSSGLHAPYAPYYYRRVRVSKQDPLALVLKDLGVPVKPENGEGDDLFADACKTWVFTFGVKTNATVRAIDESALVQLERYKLCMKYYVEHNVSFTCSVAEDEWGIVADWLYDNYDDFVGVSFLPRFDSSNSPYPQMPYESCDQDQYEAIKKDFPVLKENELLGILAGYEKAYEDYDLDAACATGSCPVR